MDYAVLRTLHIATVHLTLILFLLRGFWMLTESPRLNARWVRIVPHVNDSLLLFAAISMLVVAGLNPLEQPWLLAKITGLLAYIGIGTLALKTGKTKATRVKALVAALGVFGYILAVAITKQVIPGVV
ncbi:MAG: regulator SirB [Hydrogenophilales bacterium 28-61-23]|nr:MAG: regulator SirB [Hydrogenophilales bacterium 28-61-23]